MARPLEKDLLSNTLGRAARGALTTALTLCCLLTWSGTAAARQAGAAQPGLPSKPAPFSTAADNETVFRLPNGLTVYLIRDGRFPMTCTRLYVRTGSTHETPDQYGISHVLEHMVFKGTPTRPEGAAAREVERLGGYLNAYTSFDKTCYLTDMPSRHWKTGIDIVRDMAFNPTLDPGDLEREKPVIISELEGREDQPEGRLFLETQAAVLAGTPYAHPIIGTRETVTAVTPESLRAYIGRWYQPQNMVLVVAGDIDVDEVRAYVEAGFGGLANTGVLEDEQDISPADVAPAPRVRVLRGAWKKIYLTLSVPVPGLRDHTSLRLDLLSHLLAGDGTSLFERRYRHDRQLVDGIDVSNTSFSRLGMLTVTAVLDRDNLEEFFTSLVRDLRGLGMDAFSEEDLERARFSSLDAFDRSSETLNGLTSWRAMMQLELGGRQGEANIRTCIEQTSLAHIGETYAQYMLPGRVRVRVLAPEKQSIPDLAGILDREWPVPDAAAGKADAGTADEETLTLPNGVRLVLIPDRTMPYLSLSMAATGGNALKTPADAGLAALTADLLTDGCGGMDRVEFERRLAARALGISASSNRQTFGISATGPSRYASDLFEMLGTMIRDPRFEPAELAREVKDMNSQRVLRDESPLGRLSSRLWPSIFGDHPYGLDSLGTAATLASLDRGKVKAFWDRQRAMPWVIAVAGAYDRKQVLAWASSLPNATGQPVYPAAPVWGTEKSLTVNMPDRNKAHLMRVYPTVERLHPDAPALMVLDAVLSGQSGLLFSQMRDRDSIGYTVQSQNRFFPTTGMTLLYAGTTPDRVQDAGKGFDAILKSLAEKPLDPALLEAGCNGIEGDYIRSRQSLGSRASEAATEVLMNLPRGLALQLIEKARAVTPEDLQRVVRTYFHDGYQAVLIP